MQNTIDLNNTEILQIGILVVTDSEKLTLQK